jgi:hypothetical protein
MFCLVLLRLCGDRVWLWKWRPTTEHSNQEQAGLMHYSMESKQTTTRSRTRRETGEKRERILLGLRRCGLGHLDFSEIRVKRNLGQSHGLTCHAVALSMVAPKHKCKPTHTVILGERNNFILLWLVFGFRCVAATAWYLGFDLIDLTLDELS